MPSARSASHALGGQAQPWNRPFVGITVMGFGHRLSLVALGSTLRVRGGRNSPVAEETLGS
jgi:hypothetical protein